MFINVSLWCYHVKLSSVTQLYRQPTSFFFLPIFPPSSHPTVVCFFPVLNRSCGCLSFFCLLAWAVDSWLFQLFQLFGFDICFVAWPGLLIKIKLVLLLWKYWRCSRFTCIFRLKKRTNEIYNKIVLLPIYIRYCVHYWVTVVSMSDYWSWGHGFDPRHFHKF